MDSGEGGILCAVCFSTAIAVPEKTALLEAPQSARPWLAAAPTNPLLGFETNFAGKQKNNPHGVIFHNAFIPSGFHEMHLCKLADMHLHRFRKRTFRAPLQEALASFVLPCLPESDRKVRRFSLRRANPPAHRQSSTHGFCRSRRGLSAFQSGKLSCPLPAQT